MATIKANDITMYYEITGDGPPLTMIMGLGCSSRQWKWMVPLLADFFKVITFDNRGVGRTDKPDMEYSTDLFADDIAALLKTLGINRTHIFGISVGGMIAQKFALNYPEMVDRLVLGCTMPNFFHLPPATEDSERLQTTQLVSPEESVDIMMHLFLTEKFFTESAGLTAELQEVMLTEKLEQGAAAFLLQLGAAMSHDTLEQVKNITAPTLVITGDLDPMAPVENSRFLAEQIPESTLVEFPGVRHGFWVEKFEESSKIITNFLLNG